MAARIEGPEQSDFSLDNLLFNLLFGEEGILPAKPGTQTVPGETVA
jgi:hypothetical protein